MTAVSTAMLESATVVPKKVRLIAKPPIPRIVRSFLVNLTPSTGRFLAAIFTKSCSRPARFVRVLRDGPNHPLVVTSSDDMNINPFGVRRARESTNRRSPTEDLPATRSLAGADHDLGDLLVPSELDQRNDHEIGRAHV